MLCIAGIINLSMDNRIVGALLFSLGLTSIFVMRTPLYTGLVGNTLAKHERGWQTFLGIVLAGNLTGCLIGAGIFPLLDSAAPIVDAASVSWNAKISQSILSAFISGCFCGFLMYTAWKANQEFQRPVISTFVIVLCVMVFVLARFDHSIANAFLMFVSRSFDGRSFAYLAIMILGNTAGAFLPALVFRKV